MEALFAQELDGVADAEIICHQPAERGYCRIPLLARFYDPHKALAFLQSFNGIWSTKDMNDDLDRENSVRTTVRELVIYLLFLMVIVLCKIQLSRPSENIEKLLKVCLEEPRP